LEGKNAFLKVSGPIDRFLLSGFEETQFFDFRLNDARTLPASVESLMRPKSDRPAVTIRKVAFLIAVPSSAQVSIRHEDVHKVRRLETTVWDDYVPDGIPEGMVVYHWRVFGAEGISDFSAFVKLQSRITNLWIILTSILVAFAFGLAGNLTASNIANRWPWLVGAQEVPPSQAGEATDDRGRAQ
jgi:hypothetical protein